MTNAPRKPGEISASLMCADIENLTDTLRIFEKEGIEYLHIDVMDGVFVDNFAMGTDHVKKIREFSSIPMDFHLMVMDPEDKVEWFEPREGDFVIVHYESTRQIIKALETIRKTGARAGLALNPGTPIHDIVETLDFIDLLAVMTVNPGHAGQQIVHGSIDKVGRVREYLDEQGYGHIQIEVDGNVSFENARLLYDQGAEIFVAGSSSIFGDMDRVAAIRKLRESIEG